MIGSTIAHYRITAKLGEGGMGEVYRATDERLNREVAIKLLPASVEQDPERLARFRREAQVLAALTHPNIAAIYGLEEDDGRVAIVQELVEGATLAERVARGPLPLDDARDIARQIAEALEAAHERGIVHRDLKPANVKITPEGVVKVLDFGLAKALDSGPGTQDPGLRTQDPGPTMTSPAMTEMGVILGTAAYMSPEQARGKPVDKRADIWAFGCVLYEMLTGRTAFAGETVSDTLVAILSGTADLKALPAHVPVPVRRLLERCLDKDPRTRLRDIGEARVLLAAPPEDTREAPVMAAPATSRPWGWIALVAALAMLVGWQMFARSAPGATNAIPPFTMSRLTELKGPERSPSLSPDGKMLIYSSAIGGNYDIYLLRVGGARAINLTGESPVDDTEPAFAPDGERIAFRSEREGGGIFVMGATGESVRRVTDRGFNPTWSPDGRTLAFGLESVDDPYARQVSSQLWTVDVQTGTPTRIVETDAVQPDWSPNGQRIAYWANIGGQRDIWTVPAAGGEPVAATLDAFTDWSPTWSPDGRWLYFSSDRGGSMDLWRLAIDQASGVVSGQPQRVTGGVRDVGHAGFSADGRNLVLMAYERSADLSFHTLDPANPCKVTSTRTLRGLSTTWCSVAPDGKQLACTLRGPQEDIVTLAADGSDVRRLTDDPSKDRWPSWTPKGDELIFNSTRSKQWEVWGIRPDGSGLHQITDLGEVGNEAVAPDGRRLVATAGYYDELWLADVGTLNTRQSAKRLEGAPKGYAPVAWSPDGDHLAGVVYDESGRSTAYGIYDVGTATYRALDGFALDSRVGAWVAGWLQDSRRLVLLSGLEASVYDTATGAVCPIMPLDPFNQISLTAHSSELVVEHNIMDSSIWLMQFERE